MKEDGGPAYPEVCNNQIIPGMSLRDYFAVQASNEDIIDMQSCKPSGMISRQCARYMCADAMLSERSKE
jgi:hypothetical protein